MSAATLAIVAGIIPIILILLLLPFAFPPKRDIIHLILKNGYILRKKFRMFPTEYWEFTNAQGLKENYIIKHDNIVFLARKGIKGNYTERHLYFLQGTLSPISHRDKPDKTELNRLVSGVLHEITLKAMLKSKEGFMIILMASITCLAVGLLTGILIAPHIYGFKP
jgi:hypothetical protein